MRFGCRRARGIARILCGAGCAVVFRKAPAQDARGGAPKGAIHFRLAAGTLCEGRSPSGAPRVAISVPGAVASGRGRGPPGPPIRQAFARLRPRRVQPFKAVPRSGDGRLPEASRVRGYEPRPQAPPLPHVQRASAERPSLGEGNGLYD